MRKRGDVSNVDENSTGSVELGGQTYMGAGPGKSVPSKATTKPRGHDLPDELPESLGPYQILQEIGRGGMGLVLRGRDEALKRDVAIKIIRPGANPNAVQRMRFIKEAQITGQLEHPGIAPVHYLGWDESGNEFFSMKLVSGQPLDKLLKAWHANEKGVRREFPLSRLVHIFERVCETVGFAHSHGVIHRDLKPSNVMIGTYGEVWVLDWGLAKVVGVSEQTVKKSAPVRKHAGDTPLEAGADMTLDGTVMGTPEYMAPEQATGDELDEGVDIFGLGALLYEILGGQAPYAGKTVMDIVNNAARGKFTPLLRTAGGKRTPRGLAAITEKCMKRRRERRYENVAELLYDLRAYEDGEPLKALPDSPLDTLRRFAKNHGRGVAVLGVLLVIVMVTLTVASVMVAQKDRIAHEADAKRLEAEVDKHKTLAASAKKDQTRAAAFEPYAQAMDLLLRGQLADQAVQLLQQALKIDPEFPEAQFALGEALRQSGQPLQAAEAYLKADSLSRKITGKPNLHALIAGGFAYDGAGYYAEAEDTFKRAEGDGADDPLALVGRTFWLGHHRKLNEARSSAGKAMILAPHLWEAHFAVGYSLMESVDEGYIPADVYRPQAIKALRTALELSPRQAETCCWLGIALSRGNDDDRKEAVAFVERAIALEPQNGNRFMLRAVFHLNRGELAAADADMEQAKSLNIAPAQTQVYRAKLAINKGDTEEAFKQMELVVKETREWPSHVFNYLNMGISLGHLDQIAPVAERWMKNNPGYPPTFAYKAVLKATKKDYKGAIAEASEGLKLAPYQTTLRRMLAQSLFLDGQFKDGLDACDNVLKLAPYDFNIKIFRLGCLAKLKKTEEARGYQKELERDYPDKIKGIQDFLQQYSK
jgi:serine/threonine protein kinase/tetratricopeptide (TPR) repeat protein